MKEILENYQKATAAGKKTALATVVKVEGSAYRKEGARMLIVEDGTLHGAISGGCLEGDALRKALHVIALQRPMLVKYDSTDEDDANFGLQLGCRGIIHVLIEPIFPLDFFEKILARRQNAVLVSIFSLENRGSEQVGTRFLFLENEFFPTVEGFQTLPPFVQQVFLEKKSKIVELQNVVEVQNLDDVGAATRTQKLTALLEFVAPPPALVIFGAGNDIQPLVKFAEILGWETTVADGRPQLARAERFPAATCVLTARPDEIRRFLPADERTFFLLMTHNYQYDLAAMRVLLPERVRYIGLLGARSKFGRMLEDLQSEGFDFQADALPQVFAPVGLNIGTGSPEVIALAIVAEIQALLAGVAAPSFLKNGTEI